MLRGARSHVVVCIGHGSEYAFRTLSKRLREAGIDCIEIDTIQPGWRGKVPEALSYRRRTLLSSQHPYINRQAWVQFYGSETDIIDLPEAIDLFMPERVFYVPHDLAFPIKDEEVVALTSVTAALMPSDAFWYLRRVTKVFNVGWIGNLAASEASASMSKTDIAFLPSELGAYISRGLDHFLKVFGPVLELKPTIKFPMIDGLEPFEQKLRGMGLQVLPPHSTAAQLIEASSIVVSNGLSSIVAEAEHRGRHTICLIDDIHPEALQRSHFAALDDVIFLTPEDAVGNITEALSSNTLGAKSKAPSFNFELVYQLVSGQKKLK